MAINVKRYEVQCMLCGKTLTADVRAACLQERAESHRGALLRFVPVVELYCRGCDVYTEAGQYTMEQVGF